MNKPSKRNDHQREEGLNQTPSLKLTHQLFNLLLPWGVDDQRGQLTFFKNEIFFRSGQGSFSLNSGSCKTLKRGCIPSWLREYHQFEPFSLLHLERRKPREIPTPCKEKIKGFLQKRKITKKAIQMPFLGRGRKPQQSF